MIHAAGTPPVHSTEPTIPLWPQEPVAGSVQIPGFSFWQAREEGLRALKADAALLRQLRELWVQLRAAQRRAERGARAEQPAARQRTRELAAQLVMLAGPRLNPPLIPLWIAHPASAEREVRSTVMGYLAGLEDNPKQRPPAHLSTGTPEQTSTPNEDLQRSAP